MIGPGPWVGEDDPMRALVDELDALRDAVDELYGWVREFDPEPAPVHAYVIGERTQRAAACAVGEAFVANVEHDGA